VVFSCLKILKEARSELVMKNKLRRAAQTTSSMIRKVKTAAGSSPKKEFRKLK
jgi:hypothetical protein